MRPAFAPAAFSWLYSNWRTAVRPEHRERPMNHFTLDFLKTLYPEPIAEGEHDAEHRGRLVLFSLAPRGRSPRCVWTRSIEEAAEKAAKLAEKRHVHFGVALQAPDKALELARRKRPKTTLAHVRGCIESTVAVPAMWADLDVAADAHGSKTLPPSREAALGLLDAVPHPPSIVVRTGYGYHVYWLLKELWILDSDAERAAATSLLRRIQGALRAEARRRGWSVDQTADLARVLRLPGTFNHKLGKKVPVVVDEIRGDRLYSPSDFDVLPEPEGVVLHERRASGSPSDKDYPYRVLDGGEPADFRRVIRGCGWMRHCYDDRKDLGEEEWFAALSIAGRCKTPELDGRAIAHQMSRGHKGYVPRETDRKLEHALADAGPRKCKEIFELAGAPKYCEPCPHRVVSPIVLGRPWYKGPGSKRPPKPETAADDDRYPIPVTTREHDVNDQALAVLAECEPNLFERGGTLVEVIVPRGDVSASTRRSGDAGVAPASNGSSGSPVARPLQEARLQEVLARHCAFQKAHPGRDGNVVHLPVHPPRWCVRGLLGRGIWPELPLLTGLVEGPVLRADGSVLQKPGYDAASGLYFASGDGPRFHPVPETPSERQVAGALEQVDEMVCDFPFKTPAHRSAWLSALLTPLARFAFKGPSPLNLIDANVRGAGKSLLADVVNTVLGGRPAERMSYTRDDDELRKSITALAIEGTRLALIDNVRGSFGSPTLDRALTATLWRDRLLGANVQVAVPLRVVWFATGNNVVLQGDTPRRCLHIRLESPEERPEERTGFRRPRLLRWIAEERHRLLPAALTLLRGYVAAGRPDMGLPAWGSYEEWSDLVRSTVAWLGRPDPGDTRGGLDEGADGDGGAVAGLVSGLAELLDNLGRPATASEIVRELVEKPAIYGPLRTALEELFPHVHTGELPAPAKLAFRLRSVRGRVVNGTAVEQGPRSRGGVTWLVRQIE
jgi:hypothetical protein